MQGVLGIYHLNPVSARAVTVWYVAAIIVAVPGVLLWLDASLAAAPVLTLAALLAFVAAGLGLANRQSRGDLAAAIASLVLGIIMTGLAIVNWAFVAWEAGA